MNKTITVNLNGVVFTIEETAYEELKKYLEGVKHYFSEFEGHEEIVTDIESRIAEKFHILLKTERRKVVTMADVELIQKQVGTTNDFKSFDEDEVSVAPEPASAYSSDSEKEETAEDSKKKQRSKKAGRAKEEKAKRLFRDEDNKVLGGVCSGIASYLDVDPVIIRLAFILLLVFAGIGIIPYLILWVVLPKGKKEEFMDPYEVPDINPNRKLYRDKDNAMLGGVSSGLSAYFNIDPVILRFLFIIGTIWAGIGVLVYIILWIALPTANTIVEKLEMKNQQPILKNIKSEQQKNQGT